jgi:hypothetical protein
MESAGLRLPRWFETASRILEEQREIDQEDEGASVGRRLRVRTASLVSAHPVVVASFLAVVVGAVALRGFFGPEPLAGGVLPAFPSSVRGFFGELLSGFRTTPLGGSLAASPALGAMGALSWLTFGSTAIAQKALVVGGVVLAAVLTYRAVARLTGRPGPAVAASVSLALSALVLWSLSEGRFALSIAVAVVAATAERLEAAFSAEPPPDRRWRFVVGLGVTVAVGTAFVPGVVLGVAVLVGAQVVLGHARVRGLIIVALAAVVAGALLFPFLPTIAAGGGAALGSTIGTTDLDHLGRLALGPGPGTWIVSLFLPVAALLGYALVGVGYRARALRAVAAAGAGLALAWLSAAGRLPGPLSNAPVYASVAAVGEALLIGYGLASALSGMGRESFGLRQVGTGLLALVLGGGIFLQAVGAMLGGWAVGGPDAVPPALAVVASAKGDFRVLWIGRDDGSPFVAPGGDPVSVAQAGPSSLRYGLTGRNGTTALDVGRTLTGGGAGYLADALNEILSGATSHGGALLAPLGVRFVVADAGDVPPTAARSLDRQLDMDLIPAGGLRIYRNAAAVPPAAVVSASLEDELASSDLATIARLPSAKASPLHSVPGGWAGDATAGSRAVVSTEFDPDWTLLGGGSSSPPREAWGWATSFDTGSGSIRIRYTGQWIRTVEMSVLAVLWLAALWITRRPVAR